MNSMQFILSHVIGFMLLACSDIKNEKTCNITILNSSNQKIDSIIIKTYGLEAIFKNLEPSKKTGKALAIDYDGKQEGVFILSIYVKDSIKKQETFGYYSSASEIKPDYNIEVLNEFNVKER